MTGGIFFTVIPLLLFSYFSAGANAVTITLSQMLNVPPGLSASIVIPFLCATSVVGLIYERRTYVNKWLNIWTLMLGSTFALISLYFTFVVDSLLSNYGPGAPLARCLFAFFIPFWTVTVVSSEFSLQSFLHKRKRMHVEGK